jgi:hypothetical protein
MTARRTAAAKLAPPITKPRKKVVAAETPAKPRARRSAAVKAESSTETVATTAKPKPAPRKTAAKVNADLKAVESGRKPSGSVVAKVTGADSMQTAAKPTARKKAPAKSSPKSAIVKRSTETTDALPTDAAELRKLLKVARDRRWRAGRRADATTQAEMSGLIERIQAAIKDAAAK